MNIGGISSVTDTAAPFGFTFGNSHTQSAWSDFRRLTWPQLVDVLTSHVPGPKEGSCIVPAKFGNSRRHKDDADRIDVAFLDSDSGMTLEEIQTALVTAGWEGVISSTHSHMTTQTKVALANWDRFFTRNPNATAEQFLVEDKGYDPRVAHGAQAVETTSDMVFIEHQPCPKFRVALPLSRPWLSANYESQRQANAAWKERIEALAAALGLPHDQACTDTSRLFFLPRKPPNGVVPETAIVQGLHCDIFALPSPVPEDLFNGGPKAAPRKSQASGLAETEYTDPITGEVIDLVAWARNYGGEFLIAKAIKTRKPGVLTGHVDGSKVHIDCPNSEAHTDPGRDGATFIANGGNSETKGFVIHCRHAHCTDKDRLFFVHRMLEHRWLTCEDLTDQQFLRARVERPEEPPEMPEEAWYGLLDQIEGDAPSEIPKPDGKQHIWEQAGDWAEDEIKPRQWIAKGYLIRGSVTIIAGSGSAGKSSLTVGYSIALALGRLWSRFKPAHPCKVFVYNTEDDDEEQRRRFSAALRQFKATPADIAGKVFRVGPNAVGTLINRDQATGALRLTDVMADLENRVAAIRPDVLFLDPFIELHTSDENDNTALRSIIAYLRTLAVRYDMAVGLIHHARKGSSASAGDPDMIRGAGAIVGACRVALTVAVMTEEEANNLNVQPAERHDYFRVDGAKSNYAKMETAEWFRRAVYELANGDEVAAALPWTPKKPVQTVGTADLNQALDRIAQGFEPSVRYSSSKRGASNHRWAGYVLVEMCGLDEPTAGKLIFDWMRTRLLYEKAYRDPNDRKEKQGVYVDDSKRPT